MTHFEGRASSPRVIRVAFCTGIAIVGALSEIRYGRGGEESIFSEMERMGGEV